MGAVNCNSSGLDYFIIAEGQTKFLFIFIIFIFIFLFFFLSIIIYQAGDIEKNPGPQSVDSSETSSSCHFPFFQGNFSMVHYNV